VLTEPYCLLPADLREPCQLAAALDAAGLDPAVPTLVLSECVLVYLPPQHR
jgi:tRNA wybutosine-synthesizing protein 4